MPPLAAFWHLLNFFAPAFGLALIAPLLTKLMWRRALAGVSTAKLAAWVSGTCALVLVGGLIVFGHDGTMATYAAMVLASAVMLWWRGFGRAGR